MRQLPFGDRSRTRPRLLAVTLLAGTLGVLGMVGHAPQPAFAVGGNPDPGFANTGVFLAPVALGFSRGGNAMALQKDGKIVVAGHQVNEAFTIQDVVLWRLTKTGSLDTDFNGSGFVRLDLPGYQEAFGVAIDSRGRIVVAGTSYDTGDSDFLMARFTSSGALDPTFSGTGVVTRGFGAGSYDTGYGVAIQKDGKVVVAGDTSLNGVYDFALARFLTNGSPDPGFGGGDGLVTTDFGGNDGAYALVIQKDGKLVLAGDTTSTGNGDFALARYQKDGNLDLSFGGGDALVTTDFGSDYATSLALQPDGKIVAAGQADVAGVGKFALARYQKNGSPDPSFDTDGKVTTQLNTRAYANGVAIQKDGKFVAAGATQVGMESHLALTRSQKDGTLDQSFGLAGILVPFSPGSAANAAAIQKDGKIVVAGQAGATMFVRRFLPR